MNMRLFKFVSTIIFLSSLVTSCGSPNATPLAEQPTERVVLPTATEVRATATVAVPTATSTPEASLPEGWIAFLNQNNIWLIRPDGSELTPVTANESDNPRVGQFKWSPDGTRLAYSLSSSSGSAIFVYDVDTASTEMIVKDDVGGGFDWSPTSKQIIYDTPGSGEAFSQQNKGLRVINLENQKDRPAVKTTTEQPFITDPEWSSEGSHVLFTTPCFEISCTGQGIADYETGKLTMLPVNGGMCEWAPDDLRIACVRTLPDTSTGLEKAEIIVVNEKGEIDQNFPLEEDPTLLALLKWSADGETLLLGYYSDGKAQFDIVHLKMGERQTLATGFPSDISPDGQWILTWESGLNVAPMVSLVNAVSGEIIPLSEGTMGVWQP